MRAICLWLPLFTSTRVYYQSTQLSLYFKHKSFASSYKYPENSLTKIFQQGISLLTYYPRGFVDNVLPEYQPGEADDRELHQGYDFQSVKWFWLPSS